MSLSGVATVQLLHATIGPAVQRMPCYHVKGQLHGRYAGGLHPGISGGLYAGASSAARACNYALPPPRIGTHVALR
jgi:hypothetical protein